MDMFELVRGLSCSSHVTLTRVGAGRGKSSFASVIKLAGECPLRCTTPYHSVKTLMGHSITLEAC